MALFGNPSNKGPADTIHATSMQLQPCSSKISAIVSRWRLAGFTSAKTTLRPWRLSRSESMGEVSTSASASCSNTSDSDNESSPSQQENLAACAAKSSLRQRGGQNRSLDCMRRAHCYAPMLSCFLELARIGSLSEYSEKRALGAIDLLYRCGHCTEDICLVLAHASSYFGDAYSYCGTRMDSSEVGNIIVILLYIAHAYVLDHTCPLRLWQENLFSAQCSVRTLDMATMKLLKVRGYVLRLDEKDLQMRHECLMQAAGCMEPTGREP